ncbi:hypothetical protein VKT23_017601 [Stygiomarasmius scandens]|uniref:F-box domain-containing protein n=1 Tax=Marasmiellus scandens TaxID=2682957 RepID=A0ABR1IRQ5_9AGAR
MNPEPISTLIPPEIISKIIALLWFSPLSCRERVTLMTACPLLNRTWNAQFARIASRHLHIPSLSYLKYLAGIIFTEESRIYNVWDLQHRVETMTCFLDFEPKLESVTKDELKKKHVYLADNQEWLVDAGTWNVYKMFIQMKNYRPLKLCFPSLKMIYLDFLFSKSTTSWYQKWQMLSCHSLFRTRRSLYSTVYVEIDMFIHTRIAIHLEDTGKVITPTPVAASESGLSSWKDWISQLYHVPEQSYKVGFNVDLKLTPRTSTAVEHWDTWIENRHHALTDLRYLDADMSLRGMIFPYSFEREIKLNQKFDDVYKRLLDSRRLTMYPESELVKNTRLGSYPGAVYDFGPGAQKFGRAITCSLYADAVLLEFAVGLEPAAAIVMRHLLIANLGRGTNKATAAVFARILL